MARTWPTKRRSHAGSISVLLRSRPSPSVGVLQGWARRAHAGASRSCHGLRSLGAFLGLALFVIEWRAVPREVQEAGDFTLVPFESMIDHVVVTSETLNVPRHDETEVLRVGEGRSDLAGSLGPMRQHDPQGTASWGRGSHWGRSHPRARSRGAGHEHLRVLAQQYVSVHLGLDVVVDECGRRQG